MTARNKYTGRYKPQASEHAEQCAVVTWWSYVHGQYGLPGWALFAVPNAGGYTGGFKSNVVRVQNMKREGVRVGIPDLMLAAASPRDERARGLFIEMKRKPNKPTKQQAEVLAYLRRAGYHAVVAWSAAEAIQAIKGYLAPRVE